MPPKTCEKAPRIEALSFPCETGGKEGNKKRPVVDLTGGLVGLTGGVMKAAYILRGWNAVGSSKPYKRFSHEEGGSSIEKMRELSF